MSLVQGYREGKEKMVTDAPCVSLLYDADSRAVLLRRRQFAPTDGSEVQPIRVALNLDEIEKERDQYQTYVDDLTALLDDARKLLP